jgi:hypothetical protein
MVAQAQIVPFNPSEYKNPRNKCANTKTTASPLGSAKNPIHLLDSRVRKIKFPV